jgi:hypothetical protein
MGWFHQVPETGVVFVSYGWGELKKYVKAHLKGNNIPIPSDLNRVMMEAYCAATDSNVCLENNPYQSEIQRIWDQGTRFFQTVKSTIAAGGKLVSQEEAERRASICAKCPLNQEGLTNCISCKGKSIIADMLGFSIGRSTPIDDQLKVCNVCGCANKIKIWFPRESMLHKDLEPLWPETGCWMREG